METTQTLTDMERHALVRQRVQETSKLDPKIPLSLDGREFVLLYTNRAVKGILEDTGINILQSPLGTAEMEDPKVLGSVVFRGLQAKHPDLTSEAVDEMITFRHLMYIQSQVMAALGLFYPDVADLPVLEKDARPEVGSEDPTHGRAANGSATGLSPVRSALVS